MKHNCSAITVIADGGHIGIESARHNGFTDVHLLSNDLQQYFHQTWTHEPHFHRGKYNKLNNNNNNK